MVSYRESFPTAGSGGASFGNAVASFEPDEARPRRRRSRTADGAKEHPSKPAFDRVVKLCTQRDRSRFELMQRLVKDGYTEQEAAEAVNRAVSCNLVDDARFTDAYIRGRLSMGKGSRAIMGELKGKFGIDIAALEEDPSAFGLDEESQMERAVGFLKAHPPKAKDAWGAAYRKLLGKGYPASVAARAARAWHDSLSFS